MRPVLAIPTLGRPHLRACVESIDIDVRLLIIANGGHDWDWLPEDAWLLQPPNNLGVAASWNLAIKCYPSEPYWLIANDDTIFAPGDLSALLQRTESGEYGWVGINGDWRAFGLTAATVRAVGWFDEQFVPCFVEDADYERRCTLAGVRWGFITGETTHAGSACLRDHGHDNARTYPLNVQYYLDKWGTGIRQSGGYDTPFDQGHPLPCGPSLSRLREQAWRDPDRGTRP
jgi:hypothetical protein